MTKKIYDAMWASRGWLGRAVTISILLHLGLLIASGFIIILRSKLSPPAQFTAVPPSRPALDPHKIEMRAKMQDLQKASARPRLQPRMVVQRPSDIVLPEIKEMPDAAKRKVQREFSAVGMTGLGRGIGGGFGDGLGGGSGGGFPISFFGLKGYGRHVCYLVDYSDSLKRGGKYDIVRRELAKSITQLPIDARVCVIMFSGPAWQMGENETALRAEWHQASGGWERQGGLKKPRWILVTPDSKEKLLGPVRETRTTFGTDWMSPFKMAFMLDPKPDVIFFMTDGAPQVKNETRVLAVVKQLNGQGKKQIPINAIALGEPKIAEYMQELAKNSGGKYTVTH